MPAQRFDFFHNLQEMLLGRVIDQAFDKIKAYPAHAGPIQLGQLLSGNIGRNTGYTPSPPFGCQQSIHQSAVIMPVTGSLHDDITAEAQMITQRKKLFLAGIAWSVFTLRGIRKY